MLVVEYLNLIYRIFMENILIFKYFIYRYNLIFIYNILFSIDELFLIIIFFENEYNMFGIF